MLAANEQLVREQLVREQLVREQLVCEGVSEGRVRGACQRGPHLACA